MRTRVVAGVLALVAVAASCSTLPHGALGAQIADIRGTLDQWKQGMEARDVDAVLSLVSNEFTSRRLGNKRDYKLTLTRYFAEGTLDGAEIDTSRAQIAIERGIAIAYPVQVAAPAGPYALSFFLRQEEDATWRIIGMDVSELR